MDYSKAMNLDEVSLLDCNYLYIMKNFVTEINNGHITNFVYEERDEDKKC